MGQGELQSRFEELLDVWSSNLVLLLNLCDSEDLDTSKSGSVSSGHVLVHGFDGLSSGKGSELFDHLDRQYSFLYDMERGRLTLWVPDRESYRSQIAKFLTFNGFFS